MTHMIAGTPEGLRVKAVWVDGIIQKPAIEANDEAGWIIRFATPEEIDRLVTKPGLVWPRGHDVLIQIFGDVRIEMEDG